MASTINLWSSNIFVRIHKENSVDAYVSIRRHKNGQPSQVKTQINLNYNMIQDMYKSIDSLKRAVDMGEDFLFTTGSIKLFGNKFQSHLYINIAQEIVGQTIPKRINLNPAEYEKVIEFLISSESLLTGSGDPCFTIPDCTAKFFSYTSAEKYGYHMTGRHPQVKECGGLLTGDEKINRKKLIDHYYSMAKSEVSMTDRGLVDLLRMLSFAELDVAADYDAVIKEEDYLKPYEYLIKSLI
jgi:hypothetical protein